MDDIGREYVESLVLRNLSHENISNILKTEYPHVRGLSARSVRRFCKTNNISRAINQQNVDAMVRTAVEKVGPTYGRKMMKGFIRQNFNENISEGRIAESLKTVAPGYHIRRRTDTARQTNPIPYRADYFGHKVHVDQNEKLCRYGVTHVVAIDGHSRFVVAGCTMPIKNNKIIYENVYRKMVMQHGLMDQIRVDHGREFYLMLGMHEHVSNLRRNQTIECYKQTQSKKNLPIERFWVEVNRRVNYPIKHALVAIENEGRFNMEHQTHRFCVSWVSMAIARYGLQVCISSWNEHPIPGRGIPRTVKEITTRTAEISEESLPNGNDAVTIYCNRYNERLNDAPNFGEDPLAGNEEKKLTREHNFWERFNIENIFSSLVNEQSQLFEAALFYFINETERLLQM